MSVGDLQNDVAKGRCTRNQIRIWDQLLEVRIQMQKILNETNTLPQEGFDVLVHADDEGTNDEKNSSNLNATLKKSNSALENLLDTLLELQEELTKQNSDLQKSKRAGSKTLNGKKSGGSQSDEEILSDGGDDDEEIPSDEAGSLDGDLFDKSGDVDDEEDGEENEDKEISGEDDEEEEEEEDGGVKLAKRRKIEDYMTEVVKRQKGFAIYRDETIKKWNDKTQVATGSMGKKNFAAFQTPTLSQIQHILKDKNRLIKRTQVKRSAYSVIGKDTTSSSEAQDPNDDHDAEIFDDGDFYNQLLRELISSKTSTMTDPVQLSQHWLQIQKLRSKMKRKVDTRASKGRKIRYDVHPKLVNYMARYDNTSMPENAVKELMSSLFGKKKE